MEYDKAIRFAHNEADRLTYSIQKAMTYVRDGNFAEADKSLQEIAETAHAKEQDLQEAQALRADGGVSGRRQRRPEHLKLAEESLSHRSTISRLGPRRGVVAHPADPRRAGLRMRATRPLADQSLHSSRRWPTGSRNRVIQSSYHGAAGALLMDQKKYHDAIAHLEEDQDNPFTLELLVQAYYQDLAARQAARSRRQAARHQRSDHGAGIGRPCSRAKRPNMLGASVPQPEPRPKSHEGNRVPGSRYLAVSRFSTAKPESLHSSLTALVYSRWALIPR